jgi:hypothetical protein
MSPFQALVPGPPGHDLPGLLPPGAVATPAVGITLLVFVFQSRFKGTAVQGERNDIGSGKGAVRKSGQEALRDAAVADESDPTRLLLLLSRVGGHHDAGQRFALAEALIWACLILAQLFHAFQMKGAEHEGIEPFEVFLDVLVRPVPRWVARGLHSLEQIPLSGRP